jgi:flagellar M-ring protein FliF
VDSPPLWQAPWVSQVAKQAVGAALVLLVAFLILRPLMKSLTKTPRTPRAEEGEDKVSLSGPGGKPIKLQPSFEQQIAAARTLVGQDPKRAAQVVKDWVAADG